MQGNHAPIDLSDCSQGPCREVPFYIIGVMVYEKLKIGATGLKRNDLGSWELLSLGGIAGAFAAGAYTRSHFSST